MTDQQEGGQKRKLKKKQKQEAPDLTFDLAETFEVATAKDKDFDLDLDAAKFQGKKGQAGSRTKMIAPE